MSDETDFLGMLRGTWIGDLYCPITQLTMDELCLYGEVFRVAADLPDLADTRDEFLQLLRRVAATRIANSAERERAIERVMAYAGELVMCRPRGSG